MTAIVRVFSAGSLRHAFPVIIDAFTAATGIRISLSLGPAGLLREQIEAGEEFDLFASANMTHPRRLVEIGMAEHVICFARNRLCVIARADLGLTTKNFVDVLADPGVKIGTSTPGGDPGGDYAFEVFDRIETQHPGLGSALKRRARQLVGGRNSQPTPGGTAALIKDGEADLMMSYFSNARLLISETTLSLVEIPPLFAPKIEYGLALRRNASDQARLLMEFILGKSGQTALREAGFTLP